MERQVPGGLLLRLEMGTNGREVSHGRRSSAGIAEMLRKERATVPIVLTFCQGENRG